MARDWKATQISINSKVKKYVVYLHTEIAHSNGKEQWLMHAPTRMKARCLRVHMTGFHSMCKVSKSAKLTDGK